MTTIPLRTSARALLLAAACLGAAAGCGSPPAAGSARVAAEHGGTVLPLPGGKGFVELMVEEVKPATAKKRGQVVVYFLNADGGGPAEPAPTDVRFTPDGGQPLSLASKPLAGSKGARYASEPGPFAPGRALNGELAATVGGEAVTLPVTTR